MTTLPLATYSLSNNTVQPRHYNPPFNKELLPKLGEKLKTASQLVSHKNENLRFLTTKTFPDVKRVHLTFQMSPVTKDNINQRLMNSSSSMSRPIVFTPSESRPPIHSDLNNPGPCSYNLIQYKPHREHTSPSCSFGIRSWPEKDGGSRKSWQKPWFTSSDVWTQKVDFHRESHWPNPSTYNSTDFLTKHPTKSNPPSTVFSKAKEVFSLGKKGAEKEPGPSKYSVESGYNVTKVVSSPVSHKFRRGGTLPWSMKEITPGPSDYSPNISQVKSRSPQISIRRVKTSRFPVYTNGPFAS